MPDLMAALKASLDAVRDKDGRRNGARQGEEGAGQGEGQAKRRPRARRRQEELAAAPRRVAHRAVAATTVPRSPRLRRADCSGPGIRRRRHGRGFRYLDADGERVDDAEILARIHELVIPPAWKDVWICPYPDGHIQATGVDQRGRKQYLYHQRWRERRDQEKFDDMIQFAQALPRAARARRRRPRARRARRDRVLACAVRLLDLGFFRIGTEDYAVQTRPTAWRRSRSATCTSDGDGWSSTTRPRAASAASRRWSTPRSPTIVAAQAPARWRRRAARLQGRRPLARRAVGRHQRLPQGGDRRGLLGQGLPHLGATVLAAVALAVSDAAAGTKTARKRAITRAVKEVAYYLGNTPAVARASYIDPASSTASATATIDHRPRRGRRSRTRRRDRHPGPVEKAVLELLEGPRRRSRLGQAGASSASSAATASSRVGRIVKIWSRPVISNVLAMFGSVLTIVRRAVAGAQALDRADQDAERRGVQERRLVRSTTIRVLPASIASPAPPSAPAR